IRDCNRAMIRALLERLACAGRITDIPTAADTSDAVRRGVEAAARGDVLFVSGGVGIGGYGFVPRGLVVGGVLVKITKLRIKPGKPFVFAVNANLEKGSHLPAYVFGLPGNPVSGFVCTLRLASRLLNGWSGQSPEPNWITLPLQKPLPANGFREFY